MKGRAIIPLAVGLAIGIFAIKYFVDVVKKAKGASTDVVSVVCANCDIPMASEIKETMLEAKTLPRALAPKMYISDPKELAGRVAGQIIVTGMPIVPSVLAPKGTPTGMAPRIPEGHRAFSIQVDESAGVAGWVKPGSRVDVVAVLTNRTAGENETISKVILQNIEVLAVGQDIGTKSDAGAAVPKSVTLAVPVAELPRINLAATKGKIRLAMRNQSESETQQHTASLTDNELLGGSARKKPSGVANVMSGIFGNLPKLGTPPTDKTVRAREPKPAPEPVAAAPQPARPRHYVQLYVGSQFKGELGFCPEGETWRLVSSRDEKSLREEKDEFQKVRVASPVLTRPSQPTLFSQPLD